MAPHTTDGFVAADLLFFSVPTFISHWWLGGACAGAHVEPSLILLPTALETQGNHIQLALA